MRTAEALPVFIDVATPADTDALVLLERRSSPHPWGASDFASEMDGANGARTLALRHILPERMPALVGFCAYRLVVDELHIHNVAVSPELRRRGFGKALLAVALASAARAGACRALLEVRKANAGAQHLYRGCGFTVIGERRGYYSLPTDDAVVLSRSLG